MGEVAAANRLHALEGVSAAKAAVRLSATKEMTLLDVYMAQHDFGGLTLVAAMRVLLMRLCLAECDAYQIDRLRAAFAARYQQDHTELVVDMWHSLAMALILLNGDLHTKVSGGAFVRVGVGGVCGVGG
jgi:Sec7-like guanine-nucleotide exchange factor